MYLCLYIFICCYILSLIVALTPDGHFSDYATIASIERLNASQAPSVGAQCSRCSMPGEGTFLPTTRHEGTEGSRCTALRILSPGIR